MRNYEDVLVESLFSKDQLEKLEEVYDTAMREHFKDIELDYHAHDSRAEAMEEAIQEMFEGKIDITEGALKSLAADVMFYFI